MVESITVSFRVTRCKHAFDFMALLAPFKSNAFTHSGRPNQAAQWRAVLLPYEMSRSSHSADDKRFEKKQKKGGASFIEVVDGHKLDKISVAIPQPTTLFVPRTLKRLLHSLIL
jgi:hypothetical protein